MANFCKSLVLSVDRLDFEYLHLKWLPLLDTFIDLINKPSLEFQKLVSFFHCFTVISGNYDLIKSKDCFNEAKRNENLQIMYQG